MWVLYLLRNLCLAIVLGVLFFILGPPIVDEAFVMAGIEMLDPDYRIIDNLVNFLVGGVCSLLTVFLIILFNENATPQSESIDRRIDYAVRHAFRRHMKTHHNRENLIKRGIDDDESEKPEGV